jgi:hypothetical protein
MQCINCKTKAAIGNSQYCSKTCRAIYSRRNKRSADVSATGATLEAQQSSAAQSATDNIGQDKELISNIVSDQLNSAAYTPQGCTQSQETISDIPFNSGDILPLDLTIHDFNYDVNKYQSYVINRNKQTRDCIAATPLDVLKQSGQFIPAWRYAIG